MWPGSDGTLVYCSCFWRTGFHSVSRREPPEGIVPSDPWWGCLRSGAEDGEKQTLVAEGFHDKNLNWFFWRESPEWWLWERSRKQGVMAS